MITILATYVASDGQENTVAELLRAYAPLCLAEPGNIAFVAHRDRDDPARFYLYEQYVDQAAVDAHVTSTHYEDVAASQIRPLLASRNVAFLEAIDEST